MSPNEGYSFRHVVGPPGTGCSVEMYLAERFPHSTQSEWEARLVAGEVECNGRPSVCGNCLRAGDQLVWHRPGWVEEPVPLHFETIYQDEHLLAVAKPSGLPTLPGAGYYQHTLLSLVQQQLPAARPLHRLGRATSGLVLWALSAEAATRLSRDWSHVEKQYLALAQGVANADQYDIRVPIGPLAHPRLGTVHAASPTGKPSRSVARVIERRAATTLFEVDLHSGRPHQIRIHLAAIGHPLVGDPLYASGGQPQADQPGLPGDPGYWLHARRIVLNHPLTGIRLELNAPPPKSLDLRAFGGEA